VRASTLAVYIVVVAGGQTFGSAAWGLLAERIGSTAACLAAAVLMLLCAARILLTDSFLEPQWKRTSEI
jgi:nitrate/nitrite transporter NarK